jgi:hypothetical protein
MRRDLKKAIVKVLGWSERLGLKGVGERKWLFRREVLVG